MRKTRIILTLLIVVLLCIGLAVAALFFVDPAIFRGQLEARAAVALGRQVQFDGPIRLERSLRPRIIIEDVTIGNPDWASRTHFAEAEEFEVQVALLSLLQGELRVLDVVFSGVDLFIEEGPDGVNNYTFGDAAESAEPGVLPPVEQMVIRDVIINYQGSDGNDSTYEIAEARLWNLPGEPERIVGNGFVKGLPFSFLLVANHASELSGPENPWSVKLDFDGPDMALDLTGEMVRAFYWDRGQYRITLSGQQADSLESLFDVEFPTTGPFEFSSDLKLDGNTFLATGIEASVQGLPDIPEIQVSFGKIAGGQDLPLDLAFEGQYGEIPFKISWILDLAEKSFQVTDLAASVEGPGGSPRIEVSQGQVSAGTKDPIYLALQGQYDDTPFSVTVATKEPFEGLSQTTPSSIDVQLSLADTRLHIQGAVIPKTVLEQFELNTQLQGKTSQTLAKLFDIELPGAGPYQFSFQTQLAEGVYRLSKLKGTINGVDPWKTIRIAGGQVSVFENGAIRASLDANLDKIPLAVSLQGGPGTPANDGQKNWPLNLTVSASGARLKADGAVIIGEQQNRVQLATRINGKRFESLGPLMGTSLPALGKFDISADVSSNGNDHTARNLNVRIGSNRLRGTLRWQAQSPRPLLRGQLSSEVLTLAELSGSGSKPTAKSAQTGLLDRPIELDGFKAFDARLDLSVERIADSPISAADIGSKLTLSNGKLSADFRATLADAAVEGQIQLSQSNKIPTVNLQTAIGQINVTQTLKQLGLPDIIGGSVQAIELDGSTAGKTLRAMVEQADVTLKISPASLTYSTRVVDRTVNLVVEAAVLSANKGQPLSGTLSGTLQEAPFNATFSTANMAGLQNAAALPLRLELQATDVQFKAESSFTRPIDFREFDINYELTGQSIEELSRLADYVIPLRGAFLARGRVTASDQQLTYKEDLRVGKSDLQVDIAVLRNVSRPHVKGRILASKIHLADVALFDVDQEAASVQDDARIIPDYTFPVDILTGVDLDLDFKLEQVEAGSGILSEFGDLDARLSLKDGLFQSKIDATGFSGARLNARFELNAAVDPPLNRVFFSARDINIGKLLKITGSTDLIDGRLNLYIDLAGPGYTRRKFLGNADGRIVVVAGEGTISSRMLDLWAADLLTTMLSPSWQKQAVTPMNCLAMHVELKEGQAEVDDILLDTERITVAGSGIIDLETESVNILLAPRPKRASLVSLANPVRIEGTLSEPSVSVTRLPRRRRLLGASAGIFAGLVNPAFLLLTFADTGTGGANPCDAAIERAYETIEAGEQ